MNQLVPITADLAHALVAAAADAHFVSLH